MATPEDTKENVKDTTQSTTQQSSPEATGVLDSQQYRQTEIRRLFDALSNQNTRILAEPPANYTLKRKAYNHLHKTGVVYVVKKLPTPPKVGQWVLFNAYGQERFILGAAYPIRSEQSFLHYVRDELRDADLQQDILAHFVAERVFPVSENLYFVKFVTLQKDKIKFRKIIYAQEFDIAMEVSDFLSTRPKTEVKDIYFRYLGIDSESFWRHVLSASDLDVDIYAVSINKSVVAVAIKSAGEVLFIRIERKYAFIYEDMVQKLYDFALAN